MLKGFGFLATVTIAVLLSVAYIFGQIVPPGEVGVRQINFGPGQGFSKIGLPPGYHWSVPFYSTVHLVPQVVQTLHMEGHAKGTASNSVEIQTTDGSSVDIDVSIMTRYYESSTDKHGGPADLIQKFGTNEKEWNQKIRTAAVNELRKALGRLSTSDFYNPHMREAAIEDAQVALDARMSEYGIKVEAILLRRYIYTEERIDTAIFQKNLQDQEERLNAASSLFAQAKAELEKVSAEWDAKIKTLVVQGENGARVIRSEADLYETEKTSAADLLVAKARAEVDRLKAGALAKSQGAQVYVGKQLAPLLSSLKGGVVSELDPYDINKWITKMGLSGGGQQ